MSLNKKATIVIYLVLQSAPKYVNEVARYSVHQQCRLHLCYQYQNSKELFSLTAISVEPVEHFWPWVQLMQHGGDSDAYKSSGLLHV